MMDGWGIIFKVLNVEAQRIVKLLQQPKLDLIVG